MCRHGVRASAVSTRYSHDDEQMSIASDQETADGSLYVGDFAPAGPYQQTASTFAFENEASVTASFESQPRQQYGDVSRSLEVEESLPEEHSKDIDDHPHQRQQQAVQQQPAQQPQQRPQWSQQSPEPVQRQRSRRSVDSLLELDRHAAGSAAASVTSSLAEPGPLRQPSST